MINKNEEELGLGIKKSSEDKLIYKTEIQDAIRQCRRTMGLIPYYKRSVTGLISIIEFDIHGYKFLTTINQIKRDLNIEKKIRLYRYIIKNGLEAANPINIAKYRNEEYSWYYGALFQRVLQMLATENMLIETEKFVPIRKIGLLEDESETI